MTTPDMLVTPEDKVAIDDLIARYYWAFDGGDADAYAALWIEDGSFSGFGDPIRGHEGLKGLVRATLEQTGGTWRHHMSNVLMRYEDDRDRVSARAYLTITRGGDQPGVQLSLKGRYQFARVRGEWKVAAVETQFGA